MMDSIHQEEPSHQTEGGDTFPASRR